MVIDTGRFKTSIFKIVALAAVVSSPVSVGTINAPTSLLLIVRGDAVAVHFEVEIADSHAARRRGLMGRQKLDARTGMWFDFKDSHPVSMWMKDTVISLDLLFADQEGVVVFLQSCAKPMSLDHIDAPVPVRYVLELNAGDIKTYAISVGDRITIPGHRRELSFRSQPR